MRYAILTLTLVLFCGCAQNTESTVPQRVQQDQVTPTVTAQDQMTAGSDIKVYIINAPGASGLPDDLDGDGQEDGETAPWVTAPGTSIGKTNAGYAQSGIVLNITTGGTTPTATGSSTGTATSTQTPSQNQSNTPTLSPETSLSANAGFGMPGSALSQQATAAGSGGTVSGTEQTNTQTPQYTQIKASVDRLAQMIDLIRAALSGAGVEVPTPASQPE
jgi:hypothetical protein